MQDTSAFEVLKVKSWVKLSFNGADEAASSPTFYQTDGIIKTESIDSIMTAIDRSGSTK